MTVFLYYTICLSGQAFHTCGAHVSQGFRSFKGCSTPFIGQGITILTRKSQSFDCLALIFSLLSISAVKYRPHLVSPSNYKPIVKYDCPVTRGEFLCCTTQISVY